ncbi:MAG: hypothetical protein COA63_003095 [Methylophaga sp.]|nr:hypothetical protein [Methylophaga sp.]
MKINEIESIKPIKAKTAEQLRVDTLKNKKDKATDALKAEREQQKTAKARKKIETANKVIYAIKT